MVKSLAVAAAAAVVIIVVPVVSSVAGDHVAIRAQAGGSDTSASIGRVPARPADRSPNAVDPAVVDEAPAVSLRPADRPPNVVDPAVVDVTPAVSLRPAVELVGARDEDSVAAEEALRRFRQAGLRLPDIVIAFHDDRDACGGHDGLFQDRVVPWTVRVCSDLAFVLTHELAHAWEAANLGDPDRQRYLDHRGLASWNDADVGWGERGVEDSAFTVQQILMAGNVDPGTDRWIELADAYDVLTGSPVAWAVPDDARAVQPVGFARGARGAR